MSNFTENVKNVKSNSLVLLFAVCEILKNSGDNNEPVVDNYTRTDDDRRCVCECVCVCVCVCECEYWC